MKGIFMSVTLTLTMFSLFFGLVWMTTFELHRFNLQQSLKSGIRSTMQTCMTIRCDQDMAVELFEKYFEVGLEHFEIVQWHLMGFIQSPLMMRFKVEASLGQGWFTYDFLMDQAMIEEEVYE